MDQFDDSPNSADSHTTSSTKLQDYNQALDHFSSCSAVDDWVTGHNHRNPVQYKTHGIHVWIGTWNVNAKLTTQRLDPWIAPDPKQPLAEIFAFCLQEMVDLNTKNMANEDESAERCKAWEEFILKEVNNLSAGQYGLLASKYMVGTCIFVFMRKKLMAHHTNLHTGSVATGGMGMVTLGNKGGVGVRFKLFDTTLCFISAHLAAHRDKIKERNEDYANIISKLQFKSEWHVEDNHEKKKVLFTDMYPPLEHDVCFFAGDFNYRIDCSIPIDEVMLDAQKRNIKKLLTFDQLNTERAAGRVFQFFKEGAIKFAPTYKLLPGTLLYDERARDKKKGKGKKLRAPAWCDRVLWHHRANAISGTRAKAMSDSDESLCFRFGTGSASRRGSVMVNKLNDVTQLWYRSAPLIGSDHKPVATLLRVDCYSINQKQKVQVAEKAKTQYLDWMDSRPEVVMLPNIIEFKEVEYMRKYSNSVTLKNLDSKNGARFTVLRSAARPPKGSTDEDAISSSRWLTITPQNGMIPPGGTIELTANLQVRHEDARDLMNGRCRLDDVVFVQLQNGRTMTLYISGLYEGSCFGCRPAELVRYAKPIRGDQSGKIGATSMTVPKEMWRLCDLAAKNLVPGHSTVLRWLNDIAPTHERMAELLLHERDIPAPLDPETMHDIRYALDEGFKLELKHVADNRALVLAIFALFASIWKPEMDPKMIHISHPKNQMGTARLGAMKSVGKTFKLLLNTSEWNLLGYMVSFGRELLRCEKTRKGTLNIEMLLHIMASAMAAAQPATRKATECALASWLYPMLREPDQDQKKFILKLDPNGKHPSSMLPQITGEDIGIDLDESLL